MVYAVATGDLVFVLSLMGGLFVYARNLYMRRALPVWLVALLIGVIAVAGYYAALSKPRIDAPLPLAAIGITGTFLWTIRFPLQWWISERLGESVLPRSFWIVSIAGSALLVTYAVSQADVLMLFAYGVGSLAAVRNLVLLARARTPVPVPAASSPDAPVAG
jgi:lipid-A-disaccharide synthase-like uncharacterized protein